MNGICFHLRIGQNETGKNIESLVEERRNDQGLKSEFEEITALREEAKCLRHDADKLIKKAEELEEFGEWKNVRVERYEIEELYKEEVIDSETRNGCVDRRTFAEAAGAQGEYGFAHGKLDSGIEVELTAKLRELEDCEPFGTIFSCGHRMNEQREEGLDDNDDIPPYIYEDN